MIAAADLGGSSDEILFAVAKRRQFYTPYNKPFHAEFHSLYAQKYRRVRRY
jgi:hypothetical protein